MKHTECKDCELSNGDCGHHFEMDGTIIFDIATLGACDRYGDCVFFKPKPTGAKNCPYCNEPAGIDVTVQKELDLEMADRLEDFVTKLSKKHDLYCFLKGTVLNEVNETEYLNIVSALRYAIASLRSNGNEPT